MKPGRRKNVTSEKEFKFKDDSVVLELSRIELKYETLVPTFTNYDSTLAKTTLMASFLGSEQKQFKGGHHSSRNHWPSGFEAVTVLSIATNSKLI